MTAAIEFKNVSKRFQNATHPALDEINLTIEEGEFVTIVGTSGCGKTTLIKHINRLVEADSGKIEIFGQDIYSLEVTELRKKLVMLSNKLACFRI